MTDLHFRQRWSLRSLRRELVLGDYGLMELFAFGRTRYTPWRYVRDLRWRRGGEAVIETETGRPIRLGRGIDDLPALVDGAKERLLTDRARARAHRLDENLVSEWLDQAKGRLSRRASLAVGWMLIVAGCVALAISAFSGAFPDVVSLACGTVILGAINLLVLRSCRTEEPGLAGGDAYALICKSGDRTVEVPWGDMLAVRWTADEVDRCGRVILHIDTRRGTVIHTVMALEARAVLSVIERAVAFNTARFVSAEEPSLSDASLSPARQTEEGADRGLSQSASESLDA